MRKRSGQVHSRESSATLQLTVSLLYQWCIFSIVPNVNKCYHKIKQVHLKHFMI